jgi:hypothetical protein
LPKIVEVAKSSTLVAIYYATTKVSLDYLAFYVPIISLFSNLGIPSKCHTTSNHNQFLGSTAEEEGKPSHPIVIISGSF